MNPALTFDDVLIVPNFSDIDSRKDVSLASGLGHFACVELPIISANMDSVTGSEMARTMLLNGAQACLHRFCTIDESVKMFSDSYVRAAGQFDKCPFVSIGLGSNELTRAKALFNSGAFVFLIDVANGAQMSVVKQVKALHDICGDNIRIIVGNFAGANSVKDFLFHCGQLVDGLKVGIGPGSACTTRIKTGVGYPQLSAIKEIAEVLRDTGIATIADGGMKTSGDIAKALGAGADLCMLGGMLAGTDETPGELISEHVHQSEATHAYYSEPGYIVAKEADLNLIHGWVKLSKKYRGSASQESYDSQGKSGRHRTAEGESFLVPYKGSVKNILQGIEGGLRSSFTYVGARTLKEFQSKVSFVQITNAGYSEGLPHGKK